MNNNAITASVFNGDLFEAKKIAVEEVIQLPMHMYGQYFGTCGKKRRSDPPAINAVIAKRKLLRS